MSHELNTDDDEACDRTCDAQEHCAYHDTTRKALRSQMRCICRVQVVDSLVCPSRVISGQAWAARHANTLPVINQNDAPSV